MRRRECEGRKVGTDEALGSDRSSEIVRRRGKAWRRRVEMYMGREYLMSRSKSMASVGTRRVRDSAERRSKRMSEVVMAFANRARPLTRRSEMAISSSSDGTAATEGEERQRMSATKRTKDV